MAVHWRIPGVACVLVSFLYVRWMLKTDELDPCPCRCMSSVPIRNRAPLDSIPLAAAKTEEDTMLAVPATPGSMRRPLGRASAPAATPGSTRRQQEPRRVPAPCVLLANMAQLGDFIFLIFAM